ncbi:hypothetical protein [Agromyces sp. LHK192]|uniref:hypothetical protein n=1 Tax=Agromyces sp. LHK192 TaxID=2498704 RepID=UPI000FD8EDFA|nr:hypothetical protein [Agromyces sp. LHK192]
MSSEVEHESGIVDGEAVDERTVVVGRRAVIEDDVDRTVVVERGDPFDETAVVIRPAAEASRAGEFAPPHDAADLDRTRVVRRERAPGESGAASASDAATAEAGDDEDFDRTRVVGDRDPGTPVRADPEPAPHRTSRRSGRGDRRRTLQPAPLDPATLRPVVPGAGAGAIEPYAVRQVPATATFPPQVTDADRPTRNDDPALPSLARRSRRRAAVGVAVVAVTSVVSAAGLVAVGVLAFSG